MNERDHFDQVEPPVSDEEREAVAKLQAFLLSKRYDSKIWTEIRVLQKLRSQLPEALYRRANSMLSYADWAVTIEDRWYDDSVDSMGPAGLAPGSSFEDYHETRREWDASA